MRTRLAALACAALLAACGGAPPDEPAPPDAGEVQALADAEAMLLERPEEEAPPEPDADR